MAGKNLTRAQRLALVAAAEERHGIVADTKEALNLLDTTGVYPAGGGEFNYLPLIHGPGASEAIDAMREELTGKKGSSVFFTIVSSFIRAFIEPQLRCWTGPWFDVPGAVVDDRHPVNRLIQRPHPGLTMDDIDTIRIWDLLWHGTAYVLKRRAGGGDLQTNVDGAVVELWPWDPDKIKPRLFGRDDPRRAMSNGWTDYYSMEIGPRQRVEIPPDNVIQFTAQRRSKAPQLGVAPLKEIAAEIALDREINMFYRAVLSNLGVPGLIIAPDWGAGGVGAENKGIDKDERQKMRERVDARTTGEKRGSTVVFSRPVKVEQFESNVAAMKLDHILRHIETRVSGAIGWPAILAGLAAGLDSATYANARMLREFATEDILIGTWTGHGERWTLGLERDFGLGGDTWLCYDWPKVRALQDDDDALWKRTGEAFARGELTIGQHHQILDIELPAGVDPSLRYFDLQASSQLAGLLGPALGKERPGFGMLDLVARLAAPTATKALPDGIHTKAVDHWIPDSDDVAKASDLDTGASEEDLAAALEGGEKLVRKVDPDMRGIFRVIGAAAVIGWIFDDQEYTRKKERLEFERVRALRESLVDDSRVRIGKLTDDMIGGKMSVKEWQQAMHAEYKATHLRMATLGRGGHDQMEKADLRRVEAKVKREDRYLAQFAKRVANGDMSETGIRARAAKYADGGYRDSFTGGRYAGHVAAGFTHKSRILNTGVESCDTCISEAGQGKVPIDRPGWQIGDTICKSGDRCDIAFHKEG